MNGWKFVIKYFRSRGKEVIKRSEFLADLEPKMPEYNRGTLETYRCYLTRAGYLCSVAPGRYRVHKKIPFNIKVLEVYALAYPKERS
jgi:hypothetical protein